MRYENCLYIVMTPCKVVIEWPQLNPVNHQPLITAFYLGWG